MRRFFQRFVLFSLGGLGVALAGPAGFIVRVEGERIVVNRGMLDNVKPGDHLTVMRQGRQIAEIEIQDAKPQESTARVLQLLGQEPVLAGDSVSLGAVTPAGTPPTALSPRRQLTPMQLTMQETQEAYESLLGSRTYSHEFEQKWNGRNNNTPDFNSYSLTGVLDGLGYGIFMGGWWNATDQLIRTAQMAWMNHSIHDRMTRDYVARIELEVVHWDNELLDAYARMQAAQAGMASVEEYNALKNQLMREKNLEQNDVFQVRIRNTGELNVELAPFHWHMFLSAPGDQRVVATHYDQVLDRKLSPKQEVVGYITFPKVPGREELTVYFEDIYGDKGDVSFSR